jgi:flagellar M-ring protein FliF
LQALQGELTRTIEQIAAVDSARVHIVLPEDSLYKKNEKPATASIMLHLHPNKELTKREIKGIVNLAAHSVQGLSPENITVVDASGKILNDPDDEDEKSVSARTLTQIDMTRKMQEKMQDDLQTLLDQSLGEGRAFVRVNLELDFDQRQTDSQTYTPVVDDAGIIRSEQTQNETYNGTSTTPGGPAGTQANVPGYVGEAGNANASYENKEITRNYEVNEEKQKVIASPGSVRRVNVAVLVNDDVTRAQQDSILRSVSSAAGINADRGDTVSVEPLPFSTEAADRRAAAEQAERDRQDRILYMQIAAFLLVLAIIAYILYMRRKKKRDAERAIIEEKRRQEEEERREEAELEAARRAAIEAGELAEEELTPEEKQNRSQREAVEELIRTKPADMAMLIKTWLAEDE